MTRHNTKRKIQKQKKKEEIKKERVRKRRETMRRKAKEERLKESAMDAEFADLNKQQPILNDATRKARDEAKQASIMEQLERNIEILKALEEEYLKEQAVRDKINDEFEALGLESSEEKIEYLKTKAMQEHGAVISEGL